MTCWLRLIRPHDHGGRATRTLLSIAPCTTRSFDGATSRSFWCDPLLDTRLEFVIHGACVGMTLRAEAENPETPPERLRELVKRGQGRFVAGNPNTPPKLLLKLAAHHFESFAANPVLPLLLLEDPGFCLQIPATTLRRLLRRTDLPQTFLQTLQRHPDAEVRDSARLHVGAERSDENLNSLLQEAVRALRPSRGAMPELLDHDLAPPWLLEPIVGGSDAKMRDDVLCALARSSDPEALALHDLYRRAGAALPRENQPVRTSSELTPAEAKRLAEGGNFARRIAAAHPSTPEATLRRLATSGDLQVQKIALHHAYLSEDVLWAMAGSPLVELRKAIVGNPRVPEGLLVQLAQDTAKEVRAAVALHPLTPATALKQLAGDSEVDIRKRIAKHRMTPPAVLETLAGDISEAVRDAVACHPRTPETAIKRLLSDASAEVRCTVADRRDLSHEARLRLLLDSDDDVQFRATYSRSLSEDLRQRLIECDGRRDEIVAVLKRFPPKVRFAPDPKPRPRQVRFRFAVRTLRKPYDFSSMQRHTIALDKTTPPDELDRLANESDHYIIRAVAGNSNTRAETLRRLFSHPLRTWNLFWVLGTNPNTPSDMLDWLSQQSHEDARQSIAYNKSVPLELLERLAKDESPKVRSAVACCQRTPQHIFEQLAAEKEPKVLRALARNPAVSRALLEQLATRAATDAELREALAYNSNLPRALLKPLLTDPSDMVRRELLRNKSLTVEDLEVLSRDADPTIRRKAAEHENAAGNLASSANDSEDEASVAHRAGKSQDAAQLLQWARHSSLRVRQAVAYNKNAPPEAIAILAQDGERSVQVGVLHRPDCPVSLIEQRIAALPSESTDIYTLLQCPALKPEHWQQLARHDSEHVRTAVALSDRVPGEIQMLLIEDKKLTAHLANNRALVPEALEAIIKGADSHARHNLVLRYGTPIEVIKTIVRQSDFNGFFDKRTRAVVAERPDVDRDFLMEMANREIPAHCAKQKQRYSRWRRRKYEDQYDVVCALIRRTEIPIELFEPLIDHHDQGARRELLKRADLPAEWRARLRAGTLSRALFGPALFARVAALAHPEAPSDALQKFVERGRWIERYAVARNPAAPVALLTRLANDSNILVRSLAQERLPQALSTQ